HAQRFLAARRLEHLVAAAREHVKNQLTDACFVLDEQDCFPASQRHEGGGLVGRRRGDFLFRLGEIDPCDGTHPHLALDPDRPSALPDNTVCSRESESCPAPRIFRGEERLEEVTLRLLVHAGAGVADRYGHVLSGRYTELARGKALA